MFSGLAGSSSSACRQAARDLLNTLYKQFNEGFATHDLVCVRRLLDELQDKRPA